MKKILFPTEFSSHSPEAFRFAVEIAHAFKAQLIVMSAIGKPGFELTSEEMMAHQADVAMDRLMEFVNGNLPEAYRDQIKLEYLIKVGFPAESILKVALEENIDLIAMGMRGKTNALNTLFGSTSMSVLAKSECPVLAIPSGASYKGIQNLVYTTNFEFRDLGAINYLRKWLKVFDARLHCLHVVEQHEKEVRAFKSQSLFKETFKRYKRILFDMEKGDFKDKIEAFAKSKEADILTMMSHRRNFIARLLDRSAVNGIADQIDIPLLVMKDNAYEIDSDTAEWLNIANSIG